MLIFYDYLLTSPLEISSVWNKKLNFTKALYIMYRYPSLLYQFSSVFLSIYETTSDLVSQIIYLPVSILTLMIGVRILKLYIYAEHLLWKGSVSSIIFFKHQI